MAERFIVIGLQKENSIRQYQVVSAHSFPVEKYRKGQATTSCCDRSPRKALSYSADFAKAVQQVALKNKTTTK